MRRFIGLPGAPGEREGWALAYERAALPAAGLGPADRAGIDTGEWERLVERAGRELEQLGERVAGDADAAGAAILSVQVELLRDPALAEEVAAAGGAGRSLDEAVRRAFQVWKERLGTLSSEYLRGRVHDLEDLEARLMRLMRGGERGLPPLERPTILVARDLFPSELLQSDRRWLSGIVLAEGSRTSHTVLLAKALRIPAVLGAGPFLAELASGEKLRIDGETGEVVPIPSGAGHPASEVGDRRSWKTDAFGPGRLASRRAAPGRLADGVRVKLLVNLDLPEEAEEARRVGAQGVGLLRTELLYLAGGAGFGEEEETALYRDLFRTFPPSRAVVRLLDLGSDKPWAGRPRSFEPNPALGSRGIRFLLKDLPLFQRQLRALFRAVAAARPGSRLSLLLPMVGAVEEIERTRAVVEETRKEFPDLPAPSLGVMVEVPAMALVVDAWAPSVEFASIGTNDLVQYGTALDRALPESGDAWMEPGILRLLDLAVRGARKHRVPISVCGELAGTVAGAVVLVGLGVRALSMPPNRVPAIREGLLRFGAREAVVLARALLSAGRRGEVEARLRGFLEERGFGTEHLV